MFIVPSRALVSQQAEYVRVNSSFSVVGRILRVAEMCGNELGAWSSLQWKEALCKNDIFVGTAEIFRMALVDQGFIKPSDFSLVVIDECHNAVGNHPMASLLRDSIQCAAERDKPRVLGLTASFINGSMKNILAKRAALEALFNGNIIAPEFEDDATTEKSFMRVHVPSQALDYYEPFVSAVIKSILSPIASDLGSDVHKWTKRGVSVFKELGIAGLRFWLREGIVFQLKAHSEEMKKRAYDSVCVNIAARLDTSFPSIRATLQHANVRVDLAPKYTHKFVHLLRLLYSLVPPSTTTTSRGIVFVEQVSLTYPLAALVNRYFMLMKSNGGCDAMTLKSMEEDNFETEKLDVETMLPISGSSSMIDRVRVGNLDLFRAGSIPLLVSTNALEEGIDVPECEFIVRFDAFSTTKSHIQGSGRARCKVAKIFYFDNDPDLECYKADEMEKIGRNQDLNLSSKELESSLRDIKSQSTVGAVASIQYPFRAFRCDPSEDGGEVNFFNCLSIFYKYVQRVLKQSFDPDRLFEYNLEVVRVSPYEQRQALASITYSTTTGYQVATHENFDAFWGGHRIEEIVLPRERYASMSESDREKRRAVYVVVMKLHELELLTTSNEPSSEALSRTKHVCSALLLPNKLNLQNKYAPHLLQPSARVVPPINPFSLTSSTSTTCPISIDFKSQLICILQKMNPLVTSPQLLLTYNTRQSSPGLFVSTLQVHDHRFACRTAVGDFCSRKKDAEQSAAKALLSNIT